MRALKGLAVLTIMLAAGAAAQTQDEYLDIGINKVKPDRRADFDALNKKIVDANRRYKGDRWLAYEVEYGEQNTVYFVATRKNMAAIDQGFTAFMAAMKEAFGQAGTDKMLQDVNRCLISSQAEIRRRRWDLSYNVPQDAASLSKLIGESRWVRSTIVHVRPGHNDAFEEQVRAIKQAAESSNPSLTTLVSQSAIGQHGVVYYFSALRSSLAGYDGAKPFKEMLGDEGYAKFTKAIAEDVSSTDTLLGRFLPELSNAPEDVAATSLDFWRPKPPASATKGKPKAD
jgi:hypothetical protein